MEILIVEISKEAKKLKMSAYEKTRGTEHRHYSEKAISDKEIEEICSDITEIFNKANKRGKLATNYSDELRKNTQLLYDQLLTSEVKEIIRTTKAKFLIFSIDEQLVQIPWELLHDSTNFVCLKFATGRSVRTRQKFYGTKYRSLSSPLKMLALCDPTGDLRSAYDEGIAIRNELDRKKDKIKLDLKTTEIDEKYVKRNIRDYDIVHFAGHAEYNLKNPSQSGWIFSNGKFTPEDIAELGSTASFPSLIFSNACQSGKTEEWKIEQGYEDKIYGLANAFLLAGVRHYIGTFWRVLDESCLLFSKEFYKHIANGVSIGEALLLSRLKLIEKYGETSIIWTSYMLYGDPSISMFVSPTPREPFAAISNRKKILITTGMITLVLIGIISYSRFILHKPTTAITKPIIEENIIAVLPFENLSEDKEKDIGSGIAEVIITKLSSVEQIKLVDRSQLQKIWDEIKVTKGVDKDTRRKIGNILGAQILIIGAYQKVGDNIRITARLVNSTNGEILDTTQTIGLYKDIFQLQDIIAFNILAKLDIKITEKEKDKIKEAKPTESISAFEYFAKSNEYFIKKDYENAVKLCQKALELDPEFIQATFFLCAIYEQMKQLDLAEPYYEKLKNLAEEQSDKNILISGYLSYGAFKGKKGDYKTALEYHQRALDIAKEINSQQSYGLILGSMSVIYLGLFQDEKALEVVLESEKIFEKSNNIAALGDTYVRLGVIYALSKIPNYERSIEYLKKAEKIYESANYEFGLLNLYPSLGRAYSHIKDYNKSFKYFNKGLEIARELGAKAAEGSIYRELGYSFSKRKKYGAAEEYYNKALAITKENSDEEYVNSLKGLANLYSAQLQHEKAISCFKKLEEYSAEINDVDTLVFAKSQIANTYKIEGNYKEALKGFKEALRYKEKVSDKYTLTIINLGITTCYSRMGDEKKAERFINDTIQVAKEHDKGTEAFVLSAIGGLYEDRNDYDSAITYYDNAITILNELGLQELTKINFILSYYGMGNCYNAKKDYKRAKIYYDKALPLAVEANSPLIDAIKYKVYYLGTEEKKRDEIVNKKAQVLYDRAITEFNRGNFDSALKNLLKAEKIEPKGRKILSLKSLVYDYQGKHKEAIDTYLEYIKLLNQKDETEEIALQYSNIAYIYFHIRELDESLKYYEKALSMGKKINSEKVLLQVYADSSMTYYSLKQDEKAIQYAQKAIEIGTRIKNPQELSNAYYTLSLIYGEKDDGEKELEYAQKHLKLNEESGGVELGQSYNLMGMVYKKRDILKSIDYFNKAIEFFEKYHDRDRLGGVYHELGGIYERMSQYDKALKYYNDSLKISEELDNKWITTANYLGLEGVYYKNKNYKLSEEFRNKYIALSKELGKEEELGLMYGAFGVRYEDTDKNEAERYLLLSSSILEKFRSNKSFKFLFFNYNTLGHMYYKKKDFDKAMDYYQKAIDIAENGNITDKNMLGLAYKFLGDCSRINGNFDKTLEAYKEAKTIFSQIKGSEELIDNLNSEINIIEHGLSAMDKVRNYDDFVNRAISYHKEHKWELALEHYKEALIIAKEIKDSGKDERIKKDMSEREKWLSDEISRIDSYLKEVEISKKTKPAEYLEANAILYVRQNKLDAALENFKKALKIYEEVDDKEQIGFAKMRIGLVYLTKNDVNKADRLFQEASDTYQKIEDKEFKGLIHGVFGILFEKKGEYNKAEEEFNAAISLLEETESAKTYITAYNNCLGSVNYKKKNYRKSLEYYQKALEAGQKILDPNSLCLTEMMMAFVNFINNSFQKAGESADNALATAEIIDDKELICVLNIVKGKISLTQGNYEKASEFFNKAITNADLSGKDKLNILSYLNLAMLAKKQNNSIEYERCLSMMKGQDNFGCIERGEIVTNKEKALFKEIIEEKDFFKRIWL